MYTLLIIIGVLILILILLALITPKSYHVFRSIEIEHGADKVWEHLKYLKK